MTNFRMKPIQNLRLSDRIEEEIISMIQQGILKPGEKLPNEQQLSEELKVSRGVLREALTLLQAQGLLRRKPKDGTYINEDAHVKLMNQSFESAMKRSTFTDLLEAREALESRMVEKVVDRINDEEVDELFELLQDQGGAGHNRPLDRYFHYKLAQISQNRFYMSFIDMYYDIIQEIERTTNESKGRRESIGQEHLAIVQAIAQRDKEKAKQAVQYHLSMVGKNIDHTK